MYFKKLEIFGFKSFADKTVLNFEPGITAIVGPNGCGKSNIFDAIRWVLGEQSVKELRGSSMEDVIFNGTEQKPSLGFAEVSLTFANESRMLPIEYDEVTVTRRLFRSGESEYLLNKTTVRLKDIQELLMGTGIGAEAYSLIQQGKVDLVVSARPEDRRVIFDEAAGITKYKSKKKEAMNKLKDTENNLLRVNDIVTEVKRQIGSIERQANKARKYKDEFEKLKVMEIRLAREKITTFTRKKSDLHDHLNELKEKESNLIEEQKTLKESLTRETRQLEEIERMINSVHEEEIKLEGQVDLNNRQIGFNQERITNIEQSSQRLTEQKEQLKQRCSVQQEKIENIKRELSSLEEAGQLNEQMLKEKRNNLLTVERSIREARDKIKEHEEKILQLTSQQVNVRNSLTDVIKELQGSLARKRRLEMEHSKVRTEKEEIDQKLQNVDFQIHSLHGTITDLETNKEQQAQTIDGLNAQFSDLENRINELEKKKLFFISQKEFIEKLNTQYHDIPDPVVEGRLITEQAPLEHHTGMIGKVKEVRRAQNPGKPSFFKWKLSPSESKQLYEIVCETKFIELDPQQVSKKIDELSADIEGLIAQKSTLQDDIAKEETVLEQIEQDIHHREKSFSILKAQRKDIIEEQKKLIAELELIETETQEVGDSLEQTKKKEDELNYELDTLNQDIEWCQNDIRERQTWIATKIQEKEEISVSIAQLETEIESEKDKLARLRENYGHFSETLDNWLEEMKKIDDDVSNNQLKKEQFARECDELKAKIEGIKAQREAIKEQLGVHEGRKAEAARKADQIRQDIDANEEAQEQVSKDMHEHQMQEQEFSFSEQGIKDRLSQSYKIDIDSFSLEEDDQSAQEEIPAMSMEQQQQEIDRLKKRCDSFGNVNLVAIEEYEELKERFEFLTKQQSDLLEAKSQLMSTIQKINRSTRQKFMDTFTKVSEEFRTYYRMLFGGGEAQLILLDPENVLESGIDIVARPPGKKLQNISLLSGGEKALTAIALVFGVFKVNPSPFCVLDEIDAPLDESNVGRFSFLLKDFSKIAQFIVITHNKKTISNSDVMYGITMPETGVSRIVSVKFGEDQKEAEKSSEEVSASV